MYKAILPRTNPQRNPCTLGELKAAKCPLCKGQTDVDWAYIGGRGYVPHLVCRGTCDSYYITQIDEDLGRDYARQLLAQDATPVFKSEVA